MRRPPRRVTAAAMGGRNRCNSGAVCSSNYMNALHGSRDWQIRSAQHLMNPIFRLSSLHVASLICFPFAFLTPEARAQSAGQAKIANFSGRAQVGSGANVLITGFVVSEGATKRVLVRAVGPGLAAVGVSGTLGDPVVSLFAGPRLVQSNARWNTSGDAAAIRRVAAQAGAFPLAEGSSDSALLATVGPGAYTVHLSGANGASGIALVEVYDLDAPTAADPIKEHADNMYSEGKRQAQKKRINFSAEERKGIY